MPEAGEVVERLKEAAEKKTVYHEPPRTSRELLRQAADKIEALQSELEDARDTRFEEGCDECNAREEKAEARAQSAEGRVEALEAAVGGRLTALWNILEENDRPDTIWLPSGKNDLAYTMDERQRRYVMRLRGAISHMHEIVELARAALAPQEDKEAKEAVEISEASHGSNWNPGGIDYDSVKLPLTPSPSMRCEHYPDCRCGRRDQEAGK